MWRMGTDSPERLPSRTLDVVVGVCLTKGVRLAGVANALLALEHVELPRVSRAELRGLSEKLGTSGKACASSQ